MIHTTKNLIAALLIVMFAGDRAAAGSQMTALRPRASAERTAPEVDIRPVREVQRFIPAGTSLKASEVLPSGVPFGLCVSITVKDPAGEVVQRHDLQGAAGSEAAADTQIGGGVAGAVVTAVYHRPPGAALGASDAWKTLPVRAVVPVAPGNALPLSQILTETLGVSAGDIAGIAVRDESGQCVHRYDAPSWLQHKLDRDRQWGPEGDRHCPAGTIEVFYYPRGESALSPSAYSCAAQPALPNFCVSMNLMNAGAAIYDNHVISRNGLLNVQQRIDRIADIGAGMIYLNGPWRPSEASKGVHFNPAPDDPTKTTPGTGAVRFVESGNTTVRVEKYPTKMRTVDGVHLNDRNGSQFSSRVGVWNPSLAEGIDPEEAFVDTVVRAHARGIKVVSDFFFWIAPDMVDETNYRVTHYREIGDSLDGKPGNNPGESDRLNREFRNQPDEAAKKEWIRKELLKYEKWDKFFAVRVKEPGREERVIFVEKPYDGTNADQAHINLESENEKEVEDYFFARMKYLIDLGVDVIRVDLPHVLLPHGSETKQMKSFMTRAKAYAATQGRVVKFIGETVEWEDLGKKPYDESVQYRIAGAEYGAVYTKRLHQVFMKIEREGWGAGALHEQVEALLHRPLSYLAFLTDFDRPSAKSIGGSPEPLTMLGVALAHLCAEGKPIEWDAQRIGKPKPDLIFMMDWEDLLGLFGRLITVPGGGNGVDIDNWDGHLYAADRAEIDLQADPASQLEVFDRSPLVEVIRDFNRAVLSRKQTYVENSGVQSSNSDPSRFYTLSWRDEDGAWTIVTLDVRPGDTVMDAWVKMPAEALTQGGKDVFVPVDPLGQSGSLAVQQKDGMTVIGGINFLKGGKKYSFVRLMPRSASLAAPVISPRDTARVAESVLRARAVDERLTTARHDISREALEGAPTGAVSPQAARAWAEELIGAVPVILPPSMSFNDIYEYLRYLDEVKIVVAAADSESALSGLNEFIGRTGGNVRAWLVGDNHKIEAIIRKNELKNLAQLDHTIVQMHQNVIVIEPEPDHGGSAVPLVSFGQDETEREGVAKKIPATLTTAVDLAIREGAHVILKGNTPTDPLMRAVLQRKGEVFAPGEIMSHARYYPETLLGPVLIADGAINPVENLKEEDARVQKKVKIARNTWSLAARCGMNDPVVCLVVGKKSGDGRELAECIRVKEELERLLPGAAIEIMTAAEAFTPQKKYEPGRGRILIYPDINANIPYKACATRLPWSLEPYYDTSTVDGRVSVLRKILPSGALGGYLAVTIPCPDAGAEQKIRLLNIAREDLRRFGIEAPRIAMVSFTDRGKEFPTSPTINDAHAVIHDFHERHHPGHIKLMAWDMAFSAKAGNIKGKNEISGDPDIVMAPTNTAGETIRFLLGHIDALRIPWTERASTSCGGNIAVAIVSRSDEGPEKANALALGTFVAAEERVLRERRERESTLAEPGSLPASTTAGALDSAVLRPLAAQDRMKTVMGAALPTQSETEVVERMIGETRIECKRALLCQVRSLWLLRKLHQAGIKAWILDNKSHYWVETDEMILDAYPEGTGMGWLFVQYNFQMKEYVIFNKRSDAPERVKKLYKNGVRNEQLTNIACSGDIRAFYGEIKQYAVAVIAYFRAALYPKNAADQLDEGEVRLINGIIRSYVQYVSEIDVQALAETKAEMGCAVMVERSVLRPLPALERSPYSDDMRALRAETVIKRQVAGVRQLCGCGENDVEIISVRNDSFPEAPRQLRQGGNNTIYRAKRNGKYVIVRFPFSDMVEPYEFEKAQRLRDLFPWNNFEEASGPAKILDAGRVAVDVKSGEESPALSYIMTEFCEGATLDGLSPSSKYITACIVKGVLECAYAFHRRALCPLDYKRSNFTWTVTGGGRVIVKYVDYIDMINFRYPTGLASREITDLMPLLRELGNHVPEVDESIFGVYALKKALLKGDLQEVERIYQNEIFPLIDSAIKKFALESPAASLSFAGAGREFEPAPRALVGAVLRPRAREERAGVQALARGEINVDRDFEFVRRIERGELTRIPHPRGGKTYGEGLVPPLPALIMKYRGEDEALMREGSYIVEVVGGEEPDGGAALAALFRETLAFLDPQGASSHLPHLAGVVDIGRTALGERMGLKGWAVVYAAPGGDGFLEFCRMLAGGGRDHGLLSEPKEDPRRPNDPDLLKEKARVNRYNERMKLNNDRQRERLFCEAVLRSVDAYLAAISRMSYVHGSIRPDTLRIESDTGGRRLRPVVIADISTISRLGPLLPGDDREMAERKKCSVHADTPSSGERVTRIKRGCPVEKCCLPRDDIYALCSIFMEGLHMLRLKTTSDTPLLDAFEKVLKRHQGSATLSAGICHPSQFKRELLIESFRLRLTRYLDCVMEYMNPVADPQPPKEPPKIALELNGALRLWLHHAGCDTYPRNFTVQCIEGAYDVVFADGRRIPLPLLQRTGDRYAWRGDVYDAAGLLIDAMAVPGGIPGWVLDSEHFNRLHTPIDKRPVAVIAVTDRCPYRCVFCINTPGGSELTTAQIKERLRRIRELTPRAKVAVFSGGEPMLRADLPELMDFAHEAGFEYICIDTTGVMLPALVLERLKKYKGSVLLSLHADSVAAEDELMTNPGHFGAAMNALRVLNERGIPVLVDTVATKMNYKHIEGIGALLKKYRVAEWRIYQVVPRGMGGSVNQKRLMLTPGEFAKLIRGIECLRIKEFRVVGVGTASPFTEGWFQVTSDGRILLPEYQRDEPVDLGNIDEIADSFALAHKEGVVGAFIMGGGGHDPAHIAYPPRDHDAASSVLRPRPHAERGDNSNSFIPEQRLELFRAIEWKSDDTTPYGCATVFLTRYCNMECIPCISGALAIGSVTLPGVQHQLTKERTAEVISFLNQSGVHRLIIAGGGEPFLSESTVDRMVEIIVGAKKVDFIEVITNGLWARDTARMKRILHRINEALEERGPSAAKVSFTFSFSVDGFHQKNGMAGAAHFIAERAHRRGIVFPASNAPVTVLFQIIKGKGALGAFQALQEQLADRGVLDLGDLEEKIKPDRVGAYEQGEMKFIAGDLGAACFRYTIFPLYTTNRLMRALAAGTISPEDVLPYQKDLWSRSYQYGIYYEQVFSEAVAYHLLSIDTDGAVSPECRSALDRKGLLAGNVSEGFSIVQKRDKQDPLMRVLRQKGVGVMKAVFAKIDPEYAQRISVFASPYDTLDELLVDEDMRLRVTFGLLRYECWDSLTKRSQEAVAALEARFFPQGLQLPGRQIPVSTGGDRAEMNSV